MYWTYKVDRPMRHETMEDAISYLSSYISQLPPKMNKFLLDLNKQDFGQFEVQTSIQDEDYLNNEKVFVGLSSSQIKNDEVFETHDIKFTHEFDEGIDNLKIALVDIEVITNISLMFASEFRDLLMEMSESEEYDYTYNEDRVQLSITSHGSNIKVVSVRVGDRYYEHLNGADGSTPLIILDALSNRIKSTYIKRIEGLIDLEFGRLGDFDLDEFFDEAERERKELVIYVKDKEYTE